MRILAPLRIRDFRLLWTGMTVSLLGDGVFYVAIAWQVYQMSNAPTALAAVGIAVSIPNIVFLLAGGVVSDRFERRLVMIAADVLRACALIAIGVLAITKVIRLWHLLALTAVYGAGTGFFGPAFDAIVPDIVPPEMLTQANSLDQFIRPAALRLAGPALGGVLIGLWSAGGALFIDGLSFAFSVAMLLLMRRREPAGSVDGGHSALREIGEGFRYVRAHVWLWGTFLAATIAYLLFMGPTEVLVPFVVKYHMRGSGLTLGLVVAAGGIGAILAAIAVGQRGMPRRHVTAMYVAWAVATFAIAGYGLAVLPWQLAASAFAFNAFEAAGTIWWATTKQRLVPAELLGRVSSFDWFISIGLLPVSFALTAPVAAAIGVRSTLVWAGVLGGMVTLAALFIPGMRRIERDGALAGEPLAAQASEVEVGFGVTPAAVGPDSSWFWSR